MFYLFRFVLSWVCWFTFADKKRWREILPVCILAGFLDGIADNITAQYPLWEYNSSTIHILPYISDGLSIYPVVTYLFIQWLPNKQTLRQMLGYWFLWTTLAISIEFVHLYTGHLHYGLWWNTFWSYMFDWILFWIFYQFHKIFLLTKLKKGCRENTWYSKLKILVVDNKIIRYSFKILIADKIHISEYPYDKCDCKATYIRYYLYLFT